MKKNFVEKESGDAYVEQVQDAFWDATLEGDWVNFSAQSRLSSEIYDVVETARKFMARGNPEPAIEIGFTIIENDIDLINHNDDTQKGTKVPPFYRPPIPKRSFAYTQTSVRLYAN